MRALEGLRVVEVGDFISAPYCAKLLADLGADVVKIEPPGGDSARRYGPFRGGREDPESSGLFVYLNTSKRGIVLDLAVADGRRQLDALLADADVLVENVEPAEVAAFDLGYRTLTAEHAGLVVTSVSTFGRRGPLASYRGHALQAAAGSVTAHRTGHPARNPLGDPLCKPDFLGGVHAAAATLVALAHRDRSGRGQHVDIATQDVLAVTTTGAVLGMALSGVASVVQRGGHRVPVFHPWTVLRVADGYMEFITMQDRQWRSFLEEIGSPEWGDDPRFTDMLSRVAHADEIDRHILDAVGHRTRADLWRACRERKISFQPVHRIDEVIESDHMRERRFFVSVRNGRGEAMRVPGAPYRFSATPWEIRSKAPLLGEHSEEIRREAASADVRAKAAPATLGEPASAPLEGMRVLDFGQVWAGPQLGVYLADFGAEVIRVASPAREAVQGGARAESTDPDDPRAYDGLTRNRVSVGLDPTTTAGREILDRLLAVSDVVFDNFSPTGRQKVGLEYERLRAINSRLIVVSLSAAGQSGPWSDVRTYGPALTALFGIKSLLGYWGGEEIQEDVADLDPTAATYAMVAILAAVRARVHTGEGQFIDIAQGEAGLAALAEAVLDYELNGHVMGPTGNRHRTMAPHGIYETGGEDGGWVSISVDSEARWTALCEVLGCSVLVSDPRFLDVAARLTHQDELDEALSERTRRREAGELTAELQGHGVAAYPVVDALAALADPQLAFRRELVQVDVEGVPPSGLFTATPWRMSESRPRIFAPARATGADNEAVLRGWLKMSDAEIERAAGEGAFGSTVG